MISKQIFVAITLLLLIGTSVSSITATDLSLPNTSQAQTKVPAPAEISPEELKAKMEKKEKRPVKLKSGHIYKAASRLRFACGVSNGHNAIP